jgi:hypothetical protein
MTVGGDKSLHDVCEQLRSLWNLDPWTKITITRADQKPFWVEHNGHYNVITQYCPDIDPRVVCTIRIDLADRRSIIEDYRAVEDPVAIWADLCAKYGFQSLNASQLAVPGSPTGGLVIFGTKVPVSCSKVTIPHCLRRTVEAYIADEPWRSEALVLLASLGKEDIWKYLQTITPLPHHSQFQIISGKNDISASQTWPAGKIIVIPTKVPVTWRIEWPQEQSGVREVIQPGMTALVDVNEAWNLLHHIVPGLYDRALLNYRGNLQPGQTIQAEDVREDVALEIRFEVANKGWITFTGQTISNMSPRSEIHAHYAREDARIPPNGLLCEGGNEAVLCINDHCVSHSKRY